MRNALRRARAAALGLVGATGLVLATPAPAAQVAIPLTASSFNRDVVVESGATNDATTHFSTSVTATMDANATSIKNGTTWFQSGLAGSVAGTGLPAPGTNTSAADATTSFLLQAFTGNNAMMLGANVGALSGKLTLSTPAIYSTLSFLTAASGGSATITVIINFADAFPSLTGLTFSSPDWFNNTPIAFNAKDRVDVSAGTFDTANTANNNPRVYQENITIPLAAQGHPIDSVFLNKFSGGNTAVFAVSGTPAPEPGTIGVVGAGGLLLLVRRRRRA